jgi:hypothetical protein
MVMVYNMTGPFIIEHHLNLTPVVAGYSSLVLGFAWMVGGFIGKATLHHPFFKNMAINLTLQILFVGLMMISSHLIENLYSLILFAFLIHVGAGYTYNIYFTYCLSQSSTNAGITSGLTGGGNFVIISLLSYAIVAIVPAQNQVHLGFSYLILALFSTTLMLPVWKLRAA